VSQLEQETVNRVLKGEEARELAGEIQGLIWIFTEVDRLQKKYNDNK